MRQLKITANIAMGPPQDPIYDTYIKQAAAKEIDGETYAALLADIRSGNKDAIVTLVDSCESVIIKIMKQYLGHRKIDQKQALIEKLIAGTKKALTRLAEREVGNTGLEKFTDYWCWCVRQSCYKDFFVILSDSDLSS